MQATIGCGSGAAIGCSFGPVGTACGLVIGGLISFLVNKCTPRVDRKNDNIWFNKSHIDAKKVAAKTVDDIIGECEPFKELRSTKQYIKAGSYEDALKDFESLAPSGVHDIAKGNLGKWGNLPDGRRVTVRAGSKADVPTLEIYNPVDTTYIKIRYL